MENKLNRIVNRLIKSAADNKTKIVTVSAEYEDKKDAEKLVKKIANDYDLDIIVNSKEDGKLFVRFMKDADKAENLNEIKKLDVSEFNIKNFKVTV